MSGPTDLVLDTNAVIALLHGEAGVIAKVGQAPQFVVSIITCLEYGSYGGLSDHDVHLFAQFIRRIRVVDLAVENHALLSRIVALRQTTLLKLPDAIIAGTALTLGLPLVSRDRKLFAVPDLHTIGF